MAPLEHQVFREIRTWCFNFKIADFLTFFLTCFLFFVFYKFVIMKIQSEYDFNNESFPRFLKYERKIINGIKYVVPIILDDSYFKYYVIDFINLGTISLEEKIRNCQ